MSHDLGAPSGTNKNNGGTGVPTDKFIKDMERDQELTDKYTEDEQDIAGSVRTNNPNRNPGKDDTEGH